MTAALLAQRLDRLRTSAAHTGRAPTVRVDHALPLARALGGRTSDGIVILDAALDLPVDRAALGALPYGIPLEAPLVCLDLETTGLATAAGTVAFLVGLGVWDDERLAIRQLVLPDHALEPALLDALAAAIPAGAWLVTYNGRSFDWPLVVTRYRMHRRDAPRLAGHTDLLPIARQLWKHRTGSARLAVIESAVCGVTRSDDLPGAFIPERYFGYLRSRRPELLRAPVDHNRQDIASLGRIVSALCRLARRETWHDAQPGDLFGLARTMARRGRAEHALEYVSAALERGRERVRGPEEVALQREMGATRARLLARVGRREEAVAAWHDIAQRGGPGAAEAWLNVARHREHVMRDPAAALDACHEAAAICGRARAWGRPLRSVERDLNNRLPRLARKALALGAVRLRPAA